MIATHARFNKRDGSILLPRLARHNMRNVSAGEIFILVFTDKEEEGIKNIDLPLEIEKENSRRQIENEIRRMKNSLMGDELEESDKIPLLPMVEEEDVTRHTAREV